MSEIMPPVARPTRYDKRVADRLCTAFATSQLSLQEMIDADPGLPDQATIQQWRKQHRAFREAFEQACAWRAERLLEACADIMADLRKDMPALLARENGQALADEALATAKLEIDKTMKAVKELAPERYALMMEATQGEAGHDHTVH